MIDRLALTRERIDAIADGVMQVRRLPDPVGDVVECGERPNGLKIGQKRVPLGVIGIIYEASPNVTVDAAALCLKVVEYSDSARRQVRRFIPIRRLAKVMREALACVGLPEDCIRFVEDTSRAVATEMMKLNGYLDVLIPRGGAGLIRSVVENATVPVIETGTGNCHIYVHSACDSEMAVNIIVNAKVSRPSVCNAAESLVIDRAVAKDILPVIYETLDKHSVEIRGCDESRAICPDIKPAENEDFYTEYNDYIMSVKIVGGIDEAIAHINEHSTKHSEAIVTSDYFAAQQFLDEVDSAAVYVNASTRFTDGYEFGFGAEIGISTQKIHARGPMGLKELTTIKYIVYGNGQIR